MTFTHCIYQPGKTNLQETRTDEDATGIRYATCTGIPAETYLAELNAKRDPATPAFQIMEWDEVWPLLQAAQDAHFVDADWTEIDEDRWM